MRHGKEFRSKIFSLNPAFSYLPDEDRYLFALDQPKYRLNVIGVGLNGQEHMRVTQMEGRATIHGVFDTNPRSIAVVQRAASPRLRPAPAWRLTPRWRRPATIPRPLAW